MKKFLASIFLLLFLLLNVSLEARSEDFCIDNATEIQDALFTAAANSEEDTIQIVKGIYYGQFTFVSNTGNGITVRGGYEKVNSECQFPAQPSSPSETILSAAKCSVSELPVWK